MLHGLKNYLVQAMPRPLFLPLTAIEIPFDRSGEHRSGLVCPTRLSLSSYRRHP